MNKELKELIKERKKQAFLKNIFGKATDISKCFGKFFGHIQNNHIEEMALCDYSGDYYNDLMNKVFFDDAYIFKDNNFFIEFLIDYYFANRQIVRISYNKDVVFQCEFKGAYTPNMVPENITSYVQGDWEKRFEELYQKAKIKLQEKSKEEKKIKEKEQERKNNDLLRRFGFGKEAQ